LECTLQIKLSPVWNVHCKRTIEAGQSAGTLTIWECGIAIRLAISSLLRELRSAGWHLTPQFTGMHMPNSGSLDGASHCAFAIDKEPGRQLNISLY
jgi:hypothetical protein